ncbi:hypothetical protein [Streptomyces griseoaurantiacus]|uniref:hypothetical protein n=1 Tax=Streptomyces griseoaurantiacus TaxID=68213 RepID=UPI0036AD3F26
MRAHFNRPLLDSQGNRITEQATVRLFSPGSTDLLADTVYAESTGGVTRTNPWSTTSGEVNFYLDAPTRVKVGITVGTAPEELWDDVDVLATGVDSTHPGEGADSTQVGEESASTGQGATALGTQAQATADLSTTVGYQSTASADGAIAVGSQAAASQPGAIALGQSALSQGEQAVALGGGAHALFDRTVALGPGAVSERPDQIVLGTPDTMTYAPGPVVLRSPGGTMFSLAVADDGRLYTQEVLEYVAPPPPDEGAGEDSEVV